MISNTNPESASATQAIRHSPINPVRADVVGEAVTMEQGASLVDRLLPFDLDECELVSPLAHMLSVPLNQRDAEVAASFVRWLGTNNGRGYLHEPILGGQASLQCILDCLDAGEPTLSREPHH